METIQRAVLADPHPVAPGPMDLGASRSVASWSAPVVDPTNVSVPTGLEEVSSNDEFPADWLEREHAAEARLASSAAAPPSGGHPLPAATPARGRAMHSSSRARRGSAPPPPAVRSRSHSLVRTRTARSEVDACFYQRWVEVFFSAEPRGRGWTRFSPALPFRLWRVASS